MSRALTRLLHRLSPRLPALEVDTSAPPPPASRRRYVLAGCSSFVLGAGAGVLFWASSASVLEGVEFQLSLVGSGDVLSALFVGLAVASLTAVPVSRALLGAEAFAYYRQQYADKNEGADFVPLFRRMGGAVLLLAVLLHCMLRDTYVAADRSKLAWSDFFAFGRSEAAWSEVKELLLVRFSSPLIGPERHKPYLVWVLADGRRVRMKEHSGRQLGVEEIKLALEYSRNRGVALRRVDREG